MIPPIVQAGFDYAKAILELRAVMHYEVICQYCGYESKGSLSNIINGALPTHPQGEALYILYFETFKRKPPQSFRIMNTHTVTT